MTLAATRAARVALARVALARVALARVALARVALARVALARVVLAWSAVAVLGAASASASAPVVVPATGVAVRASSVDGLSPGAPPRLATVEITNHGTSAARLPRLTVGPGGWPSRCPAAAWSVTLPSTAPKVAAGASVRLAVAVGLTADAPASCQGLRFTVPLRPVGIAATTARLRPGVVTGSLAGSRLNLGVTAPDGQPPGVVYTVWTSPVRNRPCRGPAPLRCAGPAPRPSQPVTYRVRGELGRRWTTTSTVDLAALGLAMR